MMLANLKGMTMNKTIVVLASAWLLLPSGAQSQGKPTVKLAQSLSSAQTKAREAADITAQLQARAIAQAAARAAPAAPLVVPPVAAAPAPAAAVSPAPAAAVSPAPAAAVSPAQATLPQPPAVALDEADPRSQEMAIAQQIHQGLLPCELGASVRVEADAAAPGFFHVQGKGFRYRMYPVRTSTGALRLEDKKAGAVWLQLANKSMLMDQKKGRRMADDCAHPEQVAYGQDMKTNPPPSLFDKTGMGRSKD